MFKILLVDDEKNVLKGLKKFVNWEKYGFEIANTATSVAQALYLFESNSYDLVITDIQMPIQNGINLMEILHEKYFGTKIVVLSSYMDFSYAQQAIRFGAIDYLTKPINFDEVGKVLTNINNILQKEKNSIDDEIARTMLMNIINGESFDDGSLERYLKTNIIYRTALVTLPKLYDSSRHDFIKLVRDNFKDEDIFFMRPNTILLLLHENLDCQAVISSFLPIISKFHVSIGISDIKNSIKELADAVSESEKAVHYQLLRSASEPLIYSNIASLFTSAANGIEILSVIDRITNPTNHDAIRISIDEIIKRLSIHETIELTKTKNFCLELFLTINQVLQSHELSNEENLHLIINSTLLLFQSKTINDILEIVDSYLIFVFERFKQNESAEKQKDLIIEISNYITIHYAEKLSLSNISKKFFISPVYLSTLFKNKMGINFIDFLTKIRIDKAKEYLSSTTYSSSEISTLVGFDNARYFSSVFKKKVGCTPIEFRKKQ